MADGNGHGAAKVAEIMRQAWLPVFHGRRDNQLFLQVQGLIVPWQAGTCPGDHWREAPGRALELGSHSGQLGPVGARRMGGFTTPCCRVAGAHAPTHRGGRAMAHPDQVGQSCLPCHGRGFHHEHKGLQNTADPLSALPALSQRAPARRAGLGCWLAAPGDVRGRPMWRRRAGLVAPQRRAGRHATRRR